MDNKYLQCKNIYIEKNGRVILQNFSVTLRKNSSICILGESGSGKTLLFEKIKEFGGNVSLLGSVDFYLGELSDDYNYENVLCYLSQPRPIQNFITEFFQNGKSVCEKIKLLKKVFARPDFLVIDDLSEILNDIEKRSLFAIIRKLEITVLYATYNIEDTMFFDYTVVLKNKGIALEGKTNLVWQEEKLMKLLGYSIPFYINISRQLELYDILKKLSYSKEELEVNLWH